jgi:hypothetical protein
VQLFREKKCPMTNVTLPDRWDPATCAFDKL